MDKTLNRRDFLDALGAAMATLAVSSLGACEPEVPVPADMTETDDGPGPAVDPPGKHIALLVYPGMTMLDLIGPHTCFTALDMTQHLVWKTREPVTAESGLTVIPSSGFAECPRNLEILFVPGSTADTTAMIRDPEVMSFIRSRGQRAKLVTSVCTGSMILGAAGLLRGYKATSHWITRDMLSIVDAVPVDARYVVDRNRITGGGVTSGIDFGLRIVEQLAGRDIAESAQLLMEYAPEPPFQSGDPDTAPPHIVAGLLALFSPSIVEGTFVLEEARAKF
jgi:cyclohexyl-isocyanide hydratase